MSQKIHILKVPYDSGQRCERMARGPGYLLSKPLLKTSNIAVEAIETTLTFPAEMQTAFDLARQIAPRVRELHAAGEIPLVLAGNCNSAMGIIAGLGPRDTGVLWFDGHGEFNTPETTTSGFFDGMPLAVATGRCWATMAGSIPGFAALPDENVILVGVRDTDREEQAALDRSGIAQVRANDLNAAPGAALAAAVDRLAARVRHLYVHIDLDALDPSEATANQWVAPGGLELAAMEGALRYVAERIPLAAVTVASLDPACDEDGRALHAAETLLKTVFRIAAS